MSTNGVRAPAQNLEAEESVLGALMVSEAMVEPVVVDVGLSGDDFYSDKHRLVFQAIRSLHDRSEPVDAVTVAARLAEAGHLEEVGGRGAVSYFASTVPVPGNAAHYATIVKREAGYRQLGAEALRAQAAVRDHNGHGPAELAKEIIANVERIATPAHGLRVQSVDLRRAKPVRWAWERRLPLGYLALLLGAEGVGKGTVSAWIIAKLTRGQLPGDLRGQPARVLLVGDEDSLDSVIVPRLYAAGADLGLVDNLCEDDTELLDIRRDALRLRNLIAKRGYRLVYADALLDLLGVGIDDWRSKDVRDALRPLRRLAADLDVCVLGSLHPNKGKRDSFRDLLSGSHAFNASSRSSLLLAEHPDPEAKHRRVLVRGKGNLSAPPPSFEFSIQQRDLELNGHGFSLPVVADEREGQLQVEDVVGTTRPAAEVRESLAEEIDRIGTGGVQSRSEVAQAVGREPSDGSVGRALDQLEQEERWEKIGRGQWQRKTHVAPSLVPEFDEGGGT